MTKYLYTIAVDTAIIVALITLVGTTLTVLVTYLNARANAKKVEDPAWRSAPPQAPDQC